ncbi:MAG TPA: hypothetical protein VHZ51_27095 [Ktedonobacteraceae bacterium]|nr:hypothetical protein [Ktedonobacteraceae bacterium]
MQRSSTTPLFTVTNEPHLRVTVEVTGQFFSLTLTGGFDAVSPTGLHSSGSLLDLRGIYYSWSARSL